MKKLILLLLAVFAVSFTAQAQKQTKEEKAAAKEAEAAENMVTVQKLIGSKNFQFNPSEVQTKTGGMEKIMTYQYLKLRPESLQINMSKGPNVDTNRYEVTKNEAVKSTYVMQLKVETSAMLTIDIVVNAKTMVTTVKIASNKSETLIYKGRIKAN